MFYIFQSTNVSLKENSWVLICFCMNSAGTDSGLQSVRKNQPHADSSWERKEYSSSHFKKILFFFDTTTNIIDSFLKLVAMWVWNFIHGTTCILGYMKEKLVCFAVLNRSFIRSWPHNIASLSCVDCFQMLTHFIKQHQNIPAVHQHQSQKKNGSNLKIVKVFKYWEAVGFKVQVQIFQSCNFCFKAQNL